MNLASDSRRPAFVCAFLLLLCALATYPVAEIGMNDDWSYVQSARVLAQTGHVVYNSWATAMLGWQLYLGALFAKLFGPSFTAIRASTLLVALLTAFLSHRTFVRAGVNSRNAVVGTLALVLSPLFLPLAVSFMSDVGGLFCVVLCLYACLRALQTQTDRAVLAWLALAALSNALGGTVRQIAWLGVLVMFPCAVWLLRRRPHVMAVGTVLYVISVAFVFGSLYWYRRQPNSVPEHLFDGYPTLHQLDHLAVQLLSLFLSCALLLLPVLIAFVQKVSLRRQRTAALLACGVLFWLGVAILAFRYPRIINDLLAPFRGDYVNPFGLVPMFAIKGKPPLVLSIGFRVCITVVVLFILSFFFAFLFTSPRLSRPAQTLSESHLVSWSHLLVLLVPYAIAYCALLLPRGLHWVLLDRYLLFLFPIALIVLLRFYQDRVRLALPFPSSALVLLFAIYAVAGTHDAFSRYRAERAAIDELRSAGIPATSIDGGFEHNAMTEIERDGHILEFNVFHVAAENSRQRPNECKPFLGSLTPAIIPRYAISFNSEACEGLSGFSPVTYRNWLSHQMVSIYVVNSVKPVPSHAK